MTRVEGVGSRELQAFHRGRGRKSPGDRVAVEQGGTRHTGAASPRKTLAPMARVKAGQGERAPLAPVNRPHQQKDVFQRHDDGRSAHSISEMHADDHLRACPVRSPAVAGFSASRGGR